MRPWDFSAENFSPDENADKYIYKNGKIERYLEVGKHEHNFFLAGPKGLGKTLLITYKSYLYWKLLENIEEREKSGQRIKLNENELVESLSFSFSTFSHADIKVFSEFRIWEQFWRFCISFIILKKTGQPIPKEISRLVNDSDSLSTICGDLIMKRSKLHNILKLLNLLRPGINAIKSSVTLFIDRLDHELDNFLVDPEYIALEEANGKLNPATLMWINAQLGLLSAIFAINTSNKHIKIFATIRSEALLHRPSTLHLHFLNNLTELHYSKEEIKQIFINNIELMKPGHLVAPNAESPIKRFLGFDEMPHPRARDENQMPRVEDAFEFIYRHTFGRPREIVMLGKFLFEDELSRPDYQGLPVEEKISRVREKVNNLAYSEIFDIYKREIIPRFPEEEFHKFAHSISTNVISRTDLVELDMEFVNYLYSLGLLGYIVPDQKKKSGYRQVFLPPAKYNYNNRETIMRAEYYFTHPAIDQKLRERVEYKEFYNPFNIIGEGYDFFIPPKNTIDLTDDSLIPREFKPKKIAGARWTAHSTNNNNKHSRGLRAYYISYFNTFPPAKDWRSHLVREAWPYLDKLGFAVVAHKLDQLNGSFSSATQLIGFQEDLEKNLPQYSFRSMLGDPFSEKTLYAFQNRLIGRFITLCASLCLDLPCEIISNFLQKRNFIPEVLVQPPKGEASYRYLQGAFFICHFTNSNPIKKEDKKLIFHYCSPHEQEAMIQWFDHFKKEMEKVKWIDQFNRNSVMDSIFHNGWQPG